MIKKCSSCNEEKKHYAKGKCKLCYYTTGTNHDKHLVYLKNYRQKNPEYWNNYYHKNKNEVKEVIIDYTSIY